MASSARVAMPKLSATKILHENSCRLANPSSQTWHGGRQTQTKIFKLMKSNRFFSLRAASVAFVLTLALMAPAPSLRGQSANDGFAGSASTGNTMVVQAD